MNASVKVGQVYGYRAGSLYLVRVERKYTSCLGPRVTIAGNYHDGRAFRLTVQASDLTGSGGAPLAFGTWQAPVYA